MIDDELMSIGRFAQLNGLSIHTLRHYDDANLLTRTARWISWNVTADG